MGLNGTAPQNACKLEPAQANLEWKKLNISQYGHNKNYNDT